MGKKYLRLEFRAKVEAVKALNSEFSLCKVYVQGLGANRNRTYMSKENVQKCLPTLEYCPVVGHLTEHTDKCGNTRRYMGGHDKTTCADGSVKELTMPYGVVAKDSFAFETISENGENKEYLTANAILWTGRYPCLKEAVYSDDVWFNQSMEINVEKYRKWENDPDYTEILKWSYSALCILGKADEKSTNGTFLNGHRIPPDKYVKLNPGDKITIGATTLVMS